MSDTPIKFTRGTSTNLPETYEDGKIYFCHDTGNLKIDYGSKRYTLISSDNADIQHILGGLVVGDTNAQSLGKGRIMVTGQANPLFGLQAIGNNNERLTPYYLQVTNEDKLYLGSTPTEAMSFDKEGNITFPNTVTITNGVTQGKYAVLDSENEYAYVIGNGSSTHRSNAYTVDWDGDAWFSGNVYVSSTSGTNKDDGSKKLATEEFVNTNSVDLNSNQTIGGNKVFTGTTSTMILHTYNPLYINNDTDNSKSTSLYTNDSNVFAITSSATDMTFNGENVALMSDVDTALPKAGGTMTGALTLNADPVNAMEAATKHYVDSLVGSILNGAS